jgi:hypothetical protein
VDPAAGRALGRSLGDFAPLSSAETVLLDAARRGVDAVIATDRPSAETDANRVRADFVRFLAPGGVTDAPVHEQDVQLIGGWLTGALDLDATTIGVQITLVKCVIGTISTYDARFRVLALDGSRVDGGFLADRLTCDGAYSSGMRRSPAASVFRPRVSAATSIFTAARSAARRSRCYWPERGSAARSIFATALRRPGKSSSSGRRSMEIWNASKASSTIPAATPWWPNRSRSQATSVSIRSRRSAAGSVCTLRLSGC